MYKSHTGEVLKLGELSSAYHTSYPKLRHSLPSITHTGHHEWPTLALGYLVAAS